LGHVSASVYGYDTLERYGPLLLQAWERVLPAAGPTVAPEPVRPRKAGRTGGEPGVKTKVAPGF
jgi:hypothetical protein